MAFNPYEKYKQQSVMTMTQGEMVVRLYDEVIKQLTYAETMMAKEEYQLTNTALLKAQKIIGHLRSTLNFNIAISTNLDMLYEFFMNKMLEANIKKDKDCVADILPLISDLRDSFAQAEKNMHMQSSSPIGMQNGLRASIG